MENLLINPNPAPQEVLSEEILNALKELNEKVENEKGEWIYVDNIGIVWAPNVSPMPGAPSPEVPEPATPPPALVGLVEWGKQLDFDNLQKNSVILIKLNVQDPMRVHMMQKAIAKQVLEPRVEKLKNNRICVLFMQSDDDISVMSEEEMGQAGWEKKEKSRIIIPG